MIDRDTNYFLVSIFITRYSFLTTELNLVLVTPIGRPPNFSQMTILTNFPEFSHFFKMKLVKLVISPKSAIFLLKSPTTRKAWSVWRCFHFLCNI